MIKVTNMGKRIRKLLNKGTWVYLKPKESVVMERIDPSQEFIRTGTIFKIEDDYKKTKGED